MKRAPAQPRLSYSNIDSDLNGVKPRNVARFSLSRHRSPQRTGGAPRIPPSGLLFEESNLSPNKGDCGAVMMSDRIVLARTIAARAAIAVAACLALMGATPAFAAPPQIEDYCWAKAAQIWFNGRGDREHFLANCIADLTPTPPAKRGQNKKPR